jgi:DNA-binding MarR family transcriptional regulator
MPFLFFKNLPRYECLLEASKLFQELDPSATEVFLHLLRAGDEAVRVAGSHLAEHSLSKGRFMVLMLLLNHAHQNGRRCCSPAELADLSGVTRATMTGLIDTLERDGLVNREPDLVDRRMMVVILTEKGRSLLETVLPPHLQRMAALMAPLSLPERRTLVELLNKIAQQAQDLSPNRTAGTAAPPATESPRLQPADNHHP